MDDFWSFPELGFESVRTPLVNVEDKGKELVVTAEIPGMKKDDIHVDVEDDSLTISAKRSGVDEEKSKNYYRYERSSSSFLRRISLPESVESEKADAEYKQGVLTIVLPKKEGHVKKKGLTIR